jgi:hypothetical protein
MPTYICQRPRLRHDGEEFEEGDRVEIPEGEAKRLVQSGALAPAEDSEPLMPAEEAPEPSEDLKTLVGTRPAGALAEAGYPTIEAALELTRGELVELKGVGDATADDLEELR